MSKVIYFSGPDGAGKSTTYLSVMGELNKENVDVFPLRCLLVGRMLKNSIVKKLKKKQSTQESSDSTFSNVGKLGYSDLERDRDDGSSIFKLRRYIGLLVGLLDIIILGRLFLLYKRISGNIILVEESPYDIFVKRHRPEFPYTLLILGPLLPKSDICFLCESDAEAIVNRKPELTIDEINEYYSRIKLIFKKSNALYKSIPTDTTLEFSWSVVIKELENEKVFDL